MGMNSTVFHSPGEEERSLPDFGKNLLHIGE